MSPSEIIRSLKKTTEDAVRLFLQLSWTFFIQKTSFQIPAVKNTLSEQLYDLVETGGASPFSDLQLVTRDVALPPFEVHKVIFAARSDHFRRLFDRDRLSKAFRSECNINLGHVACRSFIEFMYRNDIGAKETLPLEVNLELLLAAELYNVEDLKSLVSHSLAGQANTSTIATIIMSAYQANARALIKAMQGLVAENLHVIMEDDVAWAALQEYPGAIFDLLRAGCTLSRNNSSRNSIEIEDWQNL